MALIEMDFASGGGGSITGFELEFIHASNENTYTVENLEVGTHYLFLIYQGSSSSKTYTQYDTTTFTNANAEKLSNLTSANTYANGTFFDVVPTATSVTISNSSALFKCIGFKAKTS